MIHKNLVTFLWAGFLSLSPAVAQEAATSALALTPYPDTETTVSRPPAGYKPFYLSTFMRHGSRYLLSATEYTEPLRMLEEAQRGGFLTPMGQELLQAVRILAEDAQGKQGTLLPRGGREHRHIMERAIAHYPEIFSGKDCRIDVYASQSGRCMMSMAYSLDAITARNPFVRFDRHSSPKIQEEVFYTYPASTISRQYRQNYSAPILEGLDNEALLDKIFTYGEKKSRYLSDAEQGQLPLSLWKMACNAVLNDEVGVDLFQFFTAEDFQNIWKTQNHIEYFTIGPSREYGELLDDQASHTLTHMLDAADVAVQGGPYRATLRYGHDSQLIPLASLMKIEGSCTPAEDLAHPETAWRVDRTCPMGANIQMVFFKKKGSDDILVKVLLNEQESHLVGIETDTWPFYHWTDLRKAYRGLIAGAPGFARDGWQNDTIQEGLIYRRFSGKEPISGVNQLIYAVDVDLNNPRYGVKFTYGERRATSEAFRDAGAVATINATYEKESVYIRVDGKTYYNIESNIVPYKGAVPQWKSDCSISTDGRNVRIEYTGKDLSIPQQRAAYEALPYPDVFTSAPMLIDHFIPVGKYFATSSLTPEQVEKLSYEDPLRHQGVRHPRSAVALTADNHLILIAVDGRRPGLAEGMNAFELTSFLEKEFHPEQAINMDGGGSTALCVKDRGQAETHVVNYPSASQTFLHDKERRVPTHIHIIDRQSGR